MSQDGIARLETLESIEILLALILATLCISRAYFHIYN